MKATYTDQELLDLIQHDSETAIEWMFRHYYAQLCRTVYRIIPQQETAEDIVQDLFLSLWNKKESLQFNTSVQSYLRRSVVNKTLNYIRDQKIKFDQPDLLDDSPDRKASVGDMLEANDLQKVIDNAVDNLPERCRIIFALSRFEQLSHQEIATELNISLKTVENQMTKALKVLRADLEPYIKGNS